MELVVLAELLRFLIKGLGVGLALVQLLAVDALLRHLEGHLQRYKLLLRGDHFLRVEVGEFFKRPFGFESAVVKLIGRFLVENAGDYLIDAFIEFRQLVDQ